MRLQRDSFFCDSRKQIHQPRDRRVPSICGNEHHGANLIAFAGREFPTATVFFQRRHRRAIVNVNAQFARAIEQQSVEEATLDSDFRVFTPR